MRKASVFCLVAIYSVIGEELKPHLAQLTGSKVCIVFREQMCTPGPCQLVRNSLFAALNSRQALLIMCVVVGPPFSKSIFLKIKMTNYVVKSL